MILRKPKKYNISITWAKSAYEYFLTKCWRRYNSIYFRTLLNIYTVKEIIELSYKPLSNNWGWKITETYQRIYRNRDERMFNRYNNWTSIKELAQEYSFTIDNIYRIVKKVKKSFGEN